MKRCPTCGTTVEAICDACGKPLKPWRETGEVMGWVHAAAGDWARCSSRGKPHPVAE